VTDSSRDPGRISPPTECDAGIEKCLIHEPLWYCITRRLLGTVLIILAIILGALWRGVSDEIDRNLFTWRIAEPISESNQFVRSEATSKVGSLGAVAVEVGMQLASLAVVIVRIQCFIAGLRCWARRGEVTLRADKRGPVVYLRSFNMEKKTKLWEAYSMKSFFLGPFLGWFPETHERSLSKAVAGIGPFVAVGNPGERFPQIGAARFYVRPENDWQQVVAELVRNASMVIMRIGCTDGFWWEFQHLLANCDPRKVVIYLPRPDHGPLYRYFQRRCAGNFPHPLPTRLGQSLFLGFDEDWKPQTIGPRGPSMAARIRHLMTGSNAPAVREALNRALRPLGLSAGRLPFQFREWLTLGLVGPYLISQYFSIIRAIVTAAGGLGVLLGIAIVLPFLLLSIVSAVFVFVWIARAILWLVRLLFRK